MNKRTVFPKISHILFAIFGLLLPLAGARADDLHVLAAANLQKVMDNALAPAYQKLTGNHVVVTYGSTKQLALQLANGAPADVFVSADTATVDDLVAKGFLVKNAEVTYAQGRLVLWSRADSHLHPSKIEDLAQPGYTKIAIANPQLAPYGLAAQQSISSVDLTAEVMPKLVQAENIGQALQFAKSGNADVAFTALSLVIDDRVDPYIVVSEKLHAPILQAADVTAESKEPAVAKSFLQFLTSPQARGIWKQYGYLEPGKKRFPFLP